MWSRLIQTLSEPRFVTGGTVAAYTVIIILGVDVLPTVHALYHPIYLVPAVFMLSGALIGMPAAWLGWRRAELVTMPITTGGLITGILVEASEIWGTDSAAHLLIALGGIVLIVVILRWVWLHRHYDQ